MKLPQIVQKNAKLEISVNIMAHQ